MFKRTTKSLVVGCMLALTALSFSTYVQAREHSKQTAGVVFTRMTEDEVRASLKKQGMTDSEVDEVIKASQEGGQVGINDISTRYFNVSCARGYYAEFHVGYGDFMHSFQKFTGGADNAYGFETSPGGWFWRVEGGGTSYQYTSVIGAPTVYHTRYGCR